VFKDLSNSGGPGRLEKEFDPTPSSASASATVAFIDLAGFSAIADVYGDAAAITVLEIFENMVRQALSSYAPPIKWIGDEACLGGRT
jgi:adenylate cyclase